MRRKYTPEWYGSNQATLGRLLKAGKTQCCYCGCEVKQAKRGQTVANHDTATLEHFYPKEDLRRYAQGGDNAVGVSCRQCNDGANRQYRIQMNVAYQNLWPITEIKLTDYI